jgi:putative endonuclease
VPISQQNKYNSVLYTGVSSDLITRVWKHKNKVDPACFTAKYNCDKLVYYIFFPTIEEAIAEEKRIKASSRLYKKQLVVSFNPEWKDLYDGLLNE